MQHAGPWHSMHGTSAEVIDAARDLKIIIKIIKKSFDLSQSRKSFITDWLS